ncbi:MAG: GNAT family N-acetyltransferase [Bacillota bacterium]|jgi:aminoglycoside 6'-N-acetyltransferase I|nr:GNAT family N-acetyltransferase [Bacillota bacterium]HOA91601.1 GNAT family N-acetyltransferase [Bacillota bacterium]HOJ45768.1 GNAT family N-acetyltransferase [Bacillota bacterium]HPQ11235.1 GNAT family N-acetyltransferase [Bacillota bacterium]HPZ73660.1 GNAT family N-acetyltransferase [Bacillota bacterium]
MKIVNMTQLNETQIMQAAQILTDSIPIGWPTLQDALDEINELLVPENTLLAAVENGDVIGWGGILPQYNGNVFELHPLAVRIDKRKQGTGRVIVTALEDEARKQGGLTIFVGADDEKDNGETSFANVDLFDDFPGKIKSFSSGTHQSGFYLKLGYKIIGVMPDANGVGKPDIFLGKRLR